jgi:hypothetical protein
MRVVSLWMVSLSVCLAGCSSLAGGKGERAPGAGASARPPEEERGATFAEEAHRWRRRTWQDEKGEIPPQALLNASAERARNLDYWRTHRAAELAALVPASWSFGGPTNVGGRTRALLVDPVNPAFLLAGSVGGGLWRSTDSGAHWLQVNDFLPNLAICSLARDPANHQVIYAGTGEGFFNADAIDGAGIFKTTDGGLTWGQLSGTSGWSSVNRIAISPTNSNIVLAATRYGGIERSTNGGSSWTNVKPAQGSYDLAFSPLDGTKAIAHILDYDFTAQDWFHQAVYSTDGGATWTPAAAPFDRLYGFYSRLELAYAPSNGTIAYLNSSVDGAIYRSTDGGHSYLLQTASGATGANWYNDMLWIDPTNPQVLVAGGSVLVRSFDGGATLTPISSGYLLTAEPHPDQHCVVSDPRYDGTTNRTVYACNDGGVFRAVDIYTASTNSGWVSLNQGYATTQFYSGRGDGPTGLVLGGAQDNGTLRLSAPVQDAHLSFGGDGGFVAVDPANPQNVYGEYIDLSQIFRSIDSGQSIDAFLDGALPESGQGNFIAPFVLDPNHPGRMLAGAYSLWRSNEVRTGAPSWQAIHAARLTQVSAIAVAPGNSDIVWVGYNDGAIYKTANATAASPTWQTVDDNGATNPLPGRIPLRILIDESNANSVYIAFGGFTTGNLQHTQNGGTSWSAVTGSGGATLPAAPIYGLAQHPAHPGWLYAGTVVGVFSSQDGGASWAASNQGPANVEVDDLAFANNSKTLIAATHGRGIWTADLSGNSEIAMSFYTLPPCRVLDTRRPVGPGGGPSLAASTARSLVATGQCGIPSSARAVAVNLTTVAPSTAGFLTLYPGSLPRPLTSTVNYRAGQVRANNSIVALAWDGSGTLVVWNGGGVTDAVLDVTGYFQ